MSLGVSIMKHGLLLRAAFEIIILHPSIIWLQQNLKYHGNRTRVVGRESPVVTARPRLLSSFVNLNKSWFEKVCFVLLFGLRPTNILLQSI